MASPTTPRYCKYFFSARGCNQGNDCKYLHQKMDEVRMELPCTALSLDIETTGCWPGVHKIVAVGVALFQLHPSHQVVELDRRLFQFQVNYPHDFDEITMRDFWHVQGRMDLLEALQNGAKPEEDAIKEFYDYYTEVCHRYPKFFLVTDNPVMDLGFLNLSIATKLGKPPLTYRPVPRASPQPSPPAGGSAEDSGLRLAGHGLEAARSPSCGLSEESESDEEELSSTDGGDEEGESDEDGFGESGEEDCGADGDAAGGSNASGGPADQLLLAQVSEIAKRVVQLQTRPAASTATADAGVAGSSGKRLASFYDDYSAPHFAIDLNSFACGLVGLHLPPFRRAGGSRWASPADFLSFHKPFLVCPYRKTHDPVDDASFNCWQFLQCVSILWMNEYAEVHQSASSARKELDTSTATATAAAKNASGAAKPTYSDAEFPTIASANATSDRKKQQQQQQRSPRRGRAASTLGAGKDKTSSPSRGSKQPHHQHARHSSSASQALTTSPSSPSSSQQHQHQQQQPTAKANPQVQRRTARSYSDPPLMAELNQSSHAASVIAKAVAFSDATPEGASAAAAAAAAERTRSRQQRAASVKVL